jgi:hypothetical protein
MGDQKWNLTPGDDHSVGFAVVRELVFLQDFDAIDHVRIRISRGADRRHDLFINQCVHGKVSF